MVRKVADFKWKNTDVSRNQEWVTWFVYFWTFFREGITVPNFIIVGYVWQTLGRGAFILSHTWTATKMAILNRIKPLDYWICYKLHFKSALHCKCLCLFFWTTGNILIPTKFYISLAISPLIVKFWCGLVIWITNTDNFLAFVINTAMTWNHRTATILDFIVIHDSCRIKRKEEF